MWYKWKDWLRKGASVYRGTLSLTGRYAVPAWRYYNARKLYVEELNARGGLLGHRVELTNLEVLKNRDRSWATNPSITLMV